MRKIVTAWVQPPIPDRRYDWQAHFDDDEPNDAGHMLVGHGRTEQDAIADLIQSADEAELGPPYEGVPQWVENYIEGKFEWH